MKTRAMLGLWTELPPAERDAAVEHIRSFQAVGKPLRQAESDRGFVDPVVVDYLRSQKTTPRVLVRRIRNRLRGRKSRDPLAEVLRAESKQAIATLAEVGAKPREPYRGFPATPDAMERFLLGLDWTKPWGAGAHAACMAVFAVTQAQDRHSEQRAQGLRDVCLRVIQQHADDATGAYFRGDRPAHGQLVNGAMKVLTALDWLGQPMHAPDRLIDSVLAEPPDPDGCHLVDAIYVLHRCAAFSSHRRDHVRDAARTMLADIDLHWHDDTGGFSYFIGRAQTTYYGVPVSDGPDAADIHGTILLTWAMVLALDLLGEKPDDWKVIRP